MSEALVGGVVRLLQSFASCSPTLFVGLLVAGVLRYYLGGDATRKLFGGESIRSLPQSWLIGMLLPVCSIGVIPILYELRRAGVRAGAMTAFALSAPLFNPLSLLYGLTLSRPLVIIAFALVSLLVVTVLGLVWDRFARSNATVGLANESTDKDEEIIGLQRLWALMLMMARSLTGAVGLLAIVACAGPMVMAMVLPHGAMQSSVEQMDPMSPLRMMLAAVPVYATPMLTMSQLGMMFQHANSPGAALVLLLLGTGMNLATLVWLTRSYGFRSTMVWFSALLLVVMSCAYAVDRPLIPPGVEPAGHTHAFDIYTNPFPPSSIVTLRTVQDVLGKSIGIGEVAGLGVLGLFALFAVLARTMGWKEATIESGTMVVGVGDGHLAEQGALGTDAMVTDAMATDTMATDTMATDTMATGRRYDVIVPPVVLGGVMLVGLVVFSIVGCFAYYPHPDETLEEMRLARVEALSGATSGNAEHALYWIGVWDDWSRRLEVGVFLRKGEVRPYQRMQGYLLRKKLELLEHELEHDPLEPDEVRKVVNQLMVSSGRYVRAFKD